MSALTAVTFARAFAIPPRSGPFCTIGSCVVTPNIIDWLVLSISGMLVIIVSTALGEMINPDLTR